jgi:hypothetical protein
LRRAKVSKECGGIFYFYYSLSHLWERSRVRVLKRTLTKEDKNILKYSVLKSD